jgi:hypothetical protein
MPYLQHGAKVAFPYYDIMGTCRHNNEPEPDDGMHNGSDMCYATLYTTAPYVDNQQ